MMRTMLLAILLIILFFGILPDLYIWQGFLRQSSLVWQVLHFLPTGVLLLAVLAMSQGRTGVEWIRVGFLILLVFCLPKVLFVLISLVGKGCGLFWPRVPGVLNGVGMVLAIVAALAFLYGGIFGWQRLETREQTLSFAELPKAFDGIRIVQISDLHTGTYGRDTRFVHRLVERVNALDADLIVFTGDLVNLRSSEVEPFMTELRRLKSKNGVISILGNHDYAMYSGLPLKEQRKDVLRLAELQDQMGWKLLRNDNCLVTRDSSTIAIVGVENTGKGPFPHLADLSRAQHDIPQGMFKILLSHDPSFWRMEVLPQTDIPLTLSGHTHAMQLAIAGFSPSSWMYDEWGGDYAEGHRHLYVSTGAGGTVAFRLGAWPSVDVITLKRGASKK